MTDEDMDGLLEPFRAQKAIDLTAFVGTWPWRMQISADAGTLSRHADRFGLGALCVSHIASVFGFDTRSGNEALVDMTAADPRLLAFGALNPVMPDVLTELDWLVAQGFRGVRLFPGYHGYALCGRPAQALIDSVLARGLPVQIVVRLDDERLRHPRFRVEEVPVHEIAETIRAWGGNRLILSGLRAADWDAVRAHLNAGDDISGVVVDLWFMNGPVGVIRRLCAAGQGRHLAYGSGTPVQTAAATAVQLATAEIEPAMRAMLCRGNAERILGGRVA